MAMPTRFSVPRRDIHGPQIPTCWMTSLYRPRMASWNLGPMHISSWHGESGGHGHSMQSFACPVLIGCFGKAIVGSIVTDTASLAAAHYRREAILATH